MFEQAENYAKSNTEHAHQVAVMMCCAELIYMFSRPVDLRDVIHTPHGPFTSATVGLLHMLYAIPNGGERQQAVAARLKAEGVKSGVPDLCWPIAVRYRGPAGVFLPHGLYIEMKKPGKLMNTSEKQDRWHADLIGQGHVVVVRDHWKTAMWALSDYSNGKQVEYRK